MRKFAIAVAAVALVVAACGNTSDQAAGPEDPLGQAPVVHADGDHADDDHGATEERAVAVTMTEFDFSFDEDSTLTVQTGETVQFVVTNAGVVEHEFRLTTAAEAQEHLEAGHEDHDDDGTDMGDADEILLLVAAGGTGTIDVTFQEGGEYDIVACLIPGHYEAGMEASVKYS